jgi:hypothetical protein
MKEARLRGVDIWMQFCKHWLSVYKCHFDKKTVCLRKGGHYKIKYKIQHRALFAETCWENGREIWDERCQAEKNNERKIISVDQSLSLSSFSFKMEDVETLTEVTFVDETSQEILVFHFLTGTGRIKLFSLLLWHGKLDRLGLTRSCSSGYIIKDIMALNDTSRCVRTIWCVVNIHNITCQL